ncbi:uncharacterized LOC106693161 [Microplitis demolitor]|uniref:uncharacterized LOC106693161 n=1 Tax=Microplitis demolitor TaxID=69319 RepID=UPI0006D4E557|nr:uncharacterized LOC106693161 [Microplitis demolitor]
MAISKKLFIKELLRNKYLKKYKKEEPEKFEKIFEVINNYEKDSIRNYNDIASCVDKISKILGLSSLEKVIMKKHIKNKILRLKSSGKKDDK